MNRPKLKIYGERNTGTNYLGKLICLNLDADELPGTVPERIRRLQRRLPGREWLLDLYFAMSYGRTLGWKHSLVNTEEAIETYRIASGDVSFVTITKNPYSWLLSLYRRPYSQYYDVKPSFEQFVCSEWRAVARDNTSRTLSSPVELWNRKNASYLQLGRRFPALNIRYEDLLEDPGSVIDVVARTFSIAYAVPRFVNYELSTKDDDKDAGFYRDYYLKERWRDTLSPEAASCINERLDDALLMHFGYEKLAVEELGVRRGAWEQFLHDKGPPPSSGELTGFRIDPRQT